MSGSPWESGSDEAPFRKGFCEQIAGCLPGPDGRQGRREEQFARRVF